MRGAVEGMAGGSGADMLDGGRDWSEGGGGENGRNSCGAGELTEISGGGTDVSSPVKSPASGYRVYPVRSEAGGADAFFEGSAVLSIFFILPWVSVFSYPYICVSVWLYT